MPPKAKYTKEQIVTAAYELVRQKGEDALSARSLAAALGTSTAPVFTAFVSIEELTLAVAERARSLYRAYLEKGLATPLPFKGAGLQYIRFAKEEPMLFRFLFMRAGGDAESVTHYMPSGDENEETVRGALMNSHASLTGDDAKALYNHLSVYCYGLAVLFAQGACIFTDEDLDRMLSEAFWAFKERIERNKGEEKNA